MQTAGCTELARGILYTSTLCLVPTTAGEKQSLQWAANNYKKAVLWQTWSCNAPYTWVPWKFSGLPDYAHGYCSQHFSQAFVQIDPMNVPTKFKVRSFTCSWDNGGTQKIWAVPGYAYAPFSPKFLMVFCSVIATFVLQNAFVPYPTSILPKIYPCSPGSRWIAFWLQIAKVLG